MKHCEHCGKPIANERDLRIDPINGSPLHRYCQADYEWEMVSDYEAEVERQERAEAKRQRKEAEKVQREAEEAQREAEEAQREAEEHAFRAQCSKVKLTTTNRVSGYEIEYDIDIITAECVYGINFFRDLFSEIRDFTGGRSRGTQHVLRDASRTCLDELRQEAVRLGADGVIGVNLDYSEFSGGSRSMLFLVASGTAVKLRSNRE